MKTGNDIYCAALFKNYRTVDGAEHPGSEDDGVLLVHVCTVTGQWVEYCTDGLYRTIANDGEREFSTLADAVAWLADQLSI